MKKIAVFGVGHLGKIHCKCIQESDKLSLVGVYDPDKDRAKTIAQEFSVPFFCNPSELLALCEIADIVTTTSAHYEMAKLAILAGKHVFIEKPVTVTLSQAEELISLVESYNVKVQVGHVERFNPAFQAALPFIQKPMFIETHRLSFFNPRGNDVSVILDLMIHDIDLVLTMVNSPITEIHASGVAVVTDTFDIANVRLTFETGCVANLTASRLSLKNMRKNRIFQQNAYISIDLLEKQSEIIHIENVPDELDDPFALILDLGESKGKKQIIIKKPEVIPQNAILSELNSLVDAVESQRLPVVSLMDGYNSLKVAHQIIEKMNATVK